MHSLLYIHVVDRIVKVIAKSMYIIVDFPFPYLTAWVCSLG